MDFFIESRKNARNTKLLPNALFLLDGKYADEVSIDKCFYLTRGRNAWQSVWVNSYYPGCFQASFESASEIAEARRTQGSKFYIDELPALTIRGQGVGVSIFEINTENPLSSFSESPVLPTNLVQVGLSRSPTVSLLERGANLGDFLRAVLTPTVHWRQEPSENNSVFVHIYLDDSAVYPKLGNRKPMRWQSESHGPDFYLGWSETDSKISSNAIRQLMS